MRAGWLAANPMTASDDEKQVPNASAGVFPATQPEGVKPNENRGGGGSGTFSQRFGPRLSQV